MRTPDREPFLSVINEVLRIHGRVRTLFREVETVTGLTNMELSVLASVAEAKVPPTVSQLGRSLGHPRQVIQRSTNDLVARGLIQTQENPAHKKARVLLITSTGLALKQQADASAESIAAAVRLDLEEDRCNEISAELRRFRHAIDRRLLGQ